MVTSKVDDLWAFGLSTNFVPDSDVSIGVSLPNLSLYTKPIWYVLIDFRDLLGIFT